MKLKVQTSPRLPVEDYDRAIHAAVSWLGDRYLLAGAVSRRAPRPAASRYFSEGPHWQARASATRAGARS